MLTRRTPEPGWKVGFEWACMGGAGGGIGRLRLCSVIFDVFVLVSVCFPNSLPYLSLSKQKDYYTLTLY